MEYRPGRLSESSASPRREVYCPQYGACLGRVVKAGWEDWTCQSCPLAGTSHPPSAHAFAHDRRGRD